MNQRMSVKSGEQPCTRVLRWFLLPPKLGAETLQHWVKPAQKEGTVNITSLRMIFIVIMQTYDNNHTFDNQVIFRNVILFMNFSITHLVLKITTFVRNIIFAEKDKLSNADINWNTFVIKTNK